MPTRSWCCRSGGLATSGTTSRSWTRGGRRVHHIVDPWTGEVAPTTWALVSVLAPTCLEANGWSTASIVWGDDAPGNLAAHGLSARLVAADGDVVIVGDGRASRTGHRPRSEWRRCGRSPKVPTGRHATDREVR